MRGGLSSELVKRLRRADPEARPIVHAEVVEAEDLIDTHDDWSSRPDSGTGLEPLLDGGIRILGSSDTHLDHGGDAISDGTDATITQLNRAGPITVLEIAWGAAGMQDVELHSLIARLDPNTGGGANIAAWHAQLFRVDQYEGEGWDVKIAAISAPTDAAPSGSAPQDVTFLLSGPSGGAVRLGEPALLQTYPTTVVMIWATTTAGAQATDCAWMAEPQTSVTVGGHGLAGFVYSVPTTTISEPAGSVWLRSAVGAPGKIGRVELVGRAYTEQVVEFTNNPLDLGAAPVGTLEFVVQGEQPGDSEITVEMDDGIAGYTEVRDGDTPESVGLASQQTYDVRVTLTPSTDGATTPTARRVGVRDLTTVSLDGLATVGGVEWSVDPVTLRGEIPEATIRVIRDGEHDYRSAIEQLLSEHYTGQIELKVYIGHHNLDRAHWLHIDSFLIDDHEDAGGAVVLTCVSPLQYAGATIPLYDAMAEKRTPVSYEGDTLKDVWDDLLDAQLGLSARYIGQGITDDTTTVTKTIEQARGKDELDAIAYIAGGAAISSQGRIKFVDMGLRAGPVAVFRKEEISAVSVTPGLRNRVEEFFVPFNWLAAEDRYDGEVRAFHGDAITKFARSYVERRDVLEDRVARWIQEEGLAETVGEREIERLGTGLIYWTFRSQYPYPELEPGDVVAVETDRFLAADPTTPTIRVLKGPLWALGVIQSVGNVMGTEFTVWIQGYASIVPSLLTITREGYGIVECDPILDEDDGVWKIVPQRTGAALSVIYTLTDDGTEPDDPLGPDDPGGPEGTVSTSDEITTVTTDVDGTRVRAKIMAARNTDGTGTKGKIHYLAGVFDGADNLPRVTWRSFDPVDTTKEGIRFVVTDDSDDVAIWVQTYNEGGSPAAWSAASHRHTNNDGVADPTGFASDPLIFDVEVTKPAEGGTRKVVMYRGEDEAGNFSEERKLIVDGDGVPSGTFVAAVDRETGIVRITPQSTDNDSASWRFRVAKHNIGTDTFDDPDFDDGDAEEFSGTAFDTPVEITDFPLVRGEQLNVSGYFFRVASDVDTDQQASTIGPNVRVQAVQGVETVNSVRIIDHQFIPVVQAGAAGWNLAVVLLKGDGCESVHLEVSWVRANGTALQPPPSTTFNIDYDEDLTLRETRLVLEDGMGTALLFVRDPEFPDDGTSDNTVAIFATPYDDSGGAGGAGTAGEPHGTRTEAPSETGAGTRVEDSAGLHYATDTVLLSANFDVALSGGRPEISIDNVPESAVTDHEAAITVAMSQVTGFAWSHISAAITTAGTFGAGNQGATWTPNFANGPSQTETATADQIIGKPSNMGSGHTMRIQITTGGFNITFAGSDFAGPTLSVAGATTVKAEIWNSGGAKYWVDVASV